MEQNKKNNLKEKEKKKVRKKTATEITDKKIEQLLNNLSAQNAVIEKLKENCKISENI